jgi:glycerate-2-kinase
MTKQLIKNFSELAKTQNHNHALQIVQAGLEAINTEKSLHREISVTETELKISNAIYRFSDYEHIYVVGTGKVACEAASVIENMLTNKIKGGAVVGISDGVCQVITTYKGTHPVPSPINYEAGGKIMNVSKAATERDLVIAIIGGGGSSLLCSDIDECEQNTRLYHDFKKTGGDIKELNTVRKHLSALKGGGLAKLLYPATVIGLIFSDVPGDNLDSVASGPTFYDDSTIADAKEIVNKYNLGDYQLRETPKDHKYFKKVNNFAVVTNHYALDAMQKHAQNLGYHVSIMTNQTYDQAAEVAKKMIAEANQKSVILVGGEWSLNVPSKTKGSGGRNSYLALLASAQIAKNQVFVAFASDGHDNSDAAGAIVDNKTIQDIYNKGVDPNECLKGFNCLPGLKAADSLIDTGYLESNVSDLAVLLTN